MAQSPKLPRIATGDAELDGVFEAWASAIEQALNITADPASGLELNRGRGGVSLRVRSRDLVLAATGVGGVSARSGTTMGSGDVSLQTFDHTGVVGGLGLAETAYNFSATAIPASKYCLCARVNGFLIVASVEC